MEKSRSRKSNIYRVEKLLKQRRVGRRIEYLVKWKNWSDINNTWEPEKNILDKRLIESFKRRLKRKDSREGVETFSPPCLTPVIRSPEHASTIPPNDPKHPPSLRLHAHVQSEPTSSQSLQRASPCSPGAYAQNLSEVDGRNGPCSSSTISSEQPMSPPPQSSSGPLNWEPGTWLPERRFRQSTLLVAAASASAAHTAAAMAISRSVIKQTSALGQNLRRASTPESSSPDRTAPQPPALPPIPCVDERPKIRLTIPRERILPCPPPGVPSSSSSSGSRNSSQLTVSSSSLAADDETDQGSFVSDADQVAARFLAPTELPRRTSLTVSSPPIAVLRTSEVTIDTYTPMDSPPSPKWNCRSGEPVSISTSLPKIIVHSPFSEQDSHRKRHQTSATICNSPESFRLDKLSSKRRRSVEKRSKHKRHRDQGCSQPALNSTHSTEAAPAYDILYPGTHPYSAVKIRRRSGSTASSLSSECCTPTTPTSSEEAPRLAPLRIQLPRSVANQLISPVTICTPPDDRPVSTRISKHPIAAVHGSCQLKETNGRNGSGLVDRVARLLAPEPNRLRLMQEICVTDVTVGDLTISIKECSGPEHFFGVPSKQLVYWVPSAKSSHTFCQPHSTEKTAGRPTPPTHAATDHFLQPPTATDENTAPTEPSAFAPDVCITSSLIPYELKTIYEEPTSSDTSPWKPDVSASTNVSFPKLEPSETADTVTTNPLTGGTSLITKSEPPHTADTSPECRSLLCTEEPINSIEVTPCSPRSLTPPRRSSTPLHHTPVSADRSWTPTVAVTSTLLSTQENPPTPNHRDESVEVPAHSDAVVQPAISTVSPERQFSGDATTGSWKLGGRSSQSISCGVKLTSTHHRRDGVTLTVSQPPKRSLKSKATAVPSSGNRGCNRRPIKPATSVPHPDDPASVYTFSDSSPTHNLPPRSVAPRVSPNSSCKRPAHSLPSCNLMVKGADHSTTSDGSIPSTELSAGSFVAFSQTCSTIPSFTGSSTLISTYPPSSIGTVNCSNSETALALCLEQLQMHLLFPDPNNIGHHMSLTCPFSMSTTSSICATSLPASSTWQPLLPTSLPPFLPTSLISADPSSLLSSFGVLPLPSISTTEPSIPAQLQLADFMAAAVSTPTVYDTSGTASAVLTPSPASDEAPIDLSAKR